MKKGIAVWTMSKLVMLIFLILTFAAVIGYVSLLSERVTADSAQSITMQLKSTLNAIIATDALDATLVVPLPTEIPERTSGVYETAEAPIKPYILVTKLERDQVSNQEYISWAVSLTNKPNIEENVYIASSWLVLPETGTVGDFNLGGTGQFVIDSTTNKTLYLLEKHTDQSGNVAVYLRSCDIFMKNCVGGQP